MKLVRPDSLVIISRQLSFILLKKALRIRKGREQTISPCSFRSYHACLHGRNIIFDSHSRRGRIATPTSRHPAACSLENSRRLPILRPLAGAWPEPGRSYGRIIRALFVFFFCSGQAPARLRPSSGHFSPK